MANKKCNRRPFDSCSCDFNYGTLNYVSGPYDRRCYNNPPYYTGPCGTIAPVRGCCECEPECCPCRCHRRHRHCRGTGYFTAGRPLTVTAGGPVNLTADYLDPESFEVDHGRIRFLDEGTYLVQYTVNVPTGIELGAQFTLEQNGTTVPGSELDVQTNTDATTTNATAQSIIRADEDDLLTLNSNSAIGIPDTGSAANIFILTIIRIC